MPLPPETTGVKNKAPAIASAVVEASPSVGVAATAGGVLAGIQLLWEIVKGAKELAGFIERNKDEKWFQDSAATFRGWRSAKTPEEKNRALEDLRALLGGRR